MQFFLPTDRKKIAGAITSSSNHNLYKLSLVVGGSG